MLKNFRTYELATQLYKECVKIKAKHYIKDQLLRASLSIVMNIAEGSGKPSRLEKRRFYSIALGSLRETQALLMLLEQNGMFELANDLGAMVYCLVHPRNKDP